MSIEIKFIKLAFLCVLTCCVMPVFAAEQRSKEMSPAQKLQFENKKAQALASFARVLNLVESQYVDPELVDMDALVEKALTAMVSGLDPHSSYLSSKRLAQFMSINPAEKGKKSPTSMMDLSHYIAYLKLKIFSVNAYNDVYKDLKNYQQTHNNKIHGLILDLRDNPGGLFDQSIQIANLFVDSGILVSTLGRDRLEPQQVEYAMKSDTFEGFPIIVLVNSKTASSSEILAGALQDRERALIMGETTYGKGSVQKVVPLPNGGAVKFTVARYYTPSGRSLQAEGVIPDVMFLPRGEGKLRNHIKNKSLSIIMQNKSIYQEIDDWNTQLRHDEMIRQAYLYIRQAL